MSIDDSIPAYKNLPTDPQELVKEFRRILRELKELDPEQIEDRINATVAPFPRLKQIRERTYWPPPYTPGVYTQDFGNGVYLDIEDRYLTGKERFAREEIKRLRSRPFWLEHRLDFIRIRAASKGITLPSESDVLSEEAESDLRQKQSAHQKKLLSRDEAAKIAGVNPKTISRWARDDLFPVTWNKDRNRIKGIPRKTYLEYLEGKQK